MRRLRGAMTAMITGALLVLGPAALAQQPDAGGAQPFGSSTWSDGLLKFLIVGVPVVLVIVIWVVLARTKPRA